MSIREGYDAVLDNTPTAEPCTSLFSLPNSVLTTIMEFIVRRANPGQVIKLALVCRALLNTVTSAEGLWEQLSISHGWSRRPTVRQRAAALTGAYTTGPEGGLSAADFDRHWFHYYTHRMTCRRNVRRFVRLYSAFLSRPSKMALMPGAEAAALSACEQRLSVELPWELWELYRFRNGQAPGTLVTFADDMRLLGLHELVLEHHPGLRELRRRLAMLVRLPGKRRAELLRPGGSAEMEAEEVAREQGTGADNSCGCEVAAAATEAAAAAGARSVCSEGLTYTVGYESKSQAPAAAAAALTLFPGDMILGCDDDYGEDCSDDRLLVVASNPSSTRRFLVALDGQVYLARGMLSLAFFASSVATMIQKLLH
ncbi:hypothetical protein VaNZ11_000370 [Volvox africanus]|uniref:F-box domain-containing protein n=1 Tax=Volvox africanus TaxID=51714 RepID=A0ABQ5RMF0_9CHLO|nr:hypothetical protein VaNZ11_000370 [Volvox africanus]